VAEDSYGGTDTLEAMIEARRYNAHLTRLVRAACGDARHVLDFGAGIGTFAAMLRDRAIAPTCLEPDPRLAGRLAAEGFRVVQSLDAVPPESLDCVYSLNVLEHIEDDAGTLAAIRDRLRPGGRLFLYVPAFDVLYSAMDRRVGHLRRYRRRPLADLVRGAGFAVERIGYVDCLGFPAALAFRAFGARDGALDPGAVRLYDRLVFPLSRALDPVLGRWFGKNLCLSAVRPGPVPAPAATNSAAASPRAGRG
jgi:SAM-dependent methyltransferase